MIAITVFTTPNVFHFGTVLMAAAILSAPWQALWPAGLLLGLAGLAGVTYMLIVLWLARHGLASYQPVLSDWLWYTVLPLVSYACLCRRGDCAPESAGPGLVRHRCSNDAVPVHWHPTTHGAVNTVWSARVSRQCQTPNLPSLLQKRRIQR